MNLPHLHDYVRVDSYSGPERGRVCYCRGPRCVVRLPEPHYGATYAVCTRAPDSDGLLWPHEYYGTTALGTAIRACDSSAAYARELVA